MKQGNTMKPRNNILSAMFFIALVVLVLAGLMALLGE